MATAGEWLEVPGHIRSPYPVQCLRQEHDKQRRAGFKKALKPSSTPIDRSCRRPQQPFAHPDRDQSLLKIEICANCCHSHLILGHNRYGQHQPAVEITIAMLSLVSLIFPARTRLLSSWRALPLWGKDRVHKIVLKDL